MPPLVGVAVKATVVPEQTVALSATMLTAGATELLTDMVTALLATEAELTQEALLVSCTVITSPLTNALLVYVADVAPEMFTPFFFH